MKYIYYGYVSFCKYLGMCIIIILQLTSVLIALNLAIGNYNTRNILYSPYEDILTKEGYYLSYFNDNSDELDYDSVTDITEDGIKIAISGEEEQENISENTYEIIHETINKFKGDVAIVELFRGMITTEVGDIGFVVIDDSIYEKLNLPLLIGDYSQAVITSNDTFLCSHSILIGSTEVKISGVLTENTYIPDMNSYNIEMDVTDLFITYNSDDRLADELGGIARTPILIVPYSLVENEVNQQLNDGIYDSFYKFVYYRTLPTEEQRQYNNKILENGSFIYMPLSDINSRSTVYVNENIQKIIPVIVCIGIIALFGILCCTCIIISRSMKTNAIYYISGATLKDCLLINACTNLIIEGASVLILTAFIKVIIALRYDVKMGFVFLYDNILVTAIIVATMLAIAEIVSVIIFIRREPKQILLMKGF